jgi:Uma2 family endonuclease
MSLVQTNLETEYPESDGKPMGETDLHRSWMERIFNLLSYRYREQQVYVSCNLLLYYAEGNPHEFVVPDIFAVKDCDPGPRRVFKVWEEGKSPNVAFEVTSRSTRREDTVFKPQAYAKIGVRELFLYDPTGDYLNPPLQGFRLTQNEQVHIQPDDSGALDCHELNLRLLLDEGQLVMSDIQTENPLLTEAEAERAAYEAERAAHEAEKAAREAAESRAQAAEQELRLLREQLRKAKDANDS